MYFCLRLGLLYVGVRFLTDPDGYRPSPSFLGGDLRIRWVRGWGQRCRRDPFLITGPTSRYRFDDGGVKEREGPLSRQDESSSSGTEGGWRVFRGLGGSGVRGLSPCASRRRLCATATGWVPSDVGDLLAPLSPRSYVDDPWLQGSILRLPEGPSSPGTHLSSSAFPKSNYSFDCSVLRLLC